MIEMVKIKGFQIHQDLTIEFDPRCTVLVGPNGTGKSCAMRAIRWLATNQPSGRRFINWDMEDARATMWADGRKLTRGIGKQGNWYALDGKRFDALGQGGVPEEVSSFLRIDDANFQSQHSLPYWMFSTAGEVARELNRIINLEVIDTSLARAAAELRKAKTVVEVRSTVGGRKKATGRPSMGAGSR